MTDPDATPSDSIATWIRSDKSRPYCTRPWNQITVLSDASVVCACIDAEKTNPLGDFRTQTFEEIWSGAGYRDLRHAIATDIDRVPICRGCPHRTAQPVPPDPDRTPARPRALFLESYAGCNLECPGCNREGIEGSRDSLSLDFDTYVKIIDSMSPDLGYMEFHLGGENYMHKRASEMVAYCRQRNPACVIVSSTNGHFFHTEERCQAVLDSGIDCLIFSIDGARQESYERYRRNGRLDRVLDGLKRLSTMKREQGKERPILVWRYILFSWNDTAEEMELARDLAREHGADHLSWHLNAVATQSASKRYYVGSPHLGEIAHELWDTLPGRLGWSHGVDFDAYA